MLRIAGDDAADMDATGGVDKVAVTQMNAYMAGTLRRVAEKEQIAFFEVFQPADVNRLAVFHLLRGIAGQDKTLCVKYQLGKAGAIDGFAGRPTPQVRKTHHFFRVSDDGIDFGCQ